MDNPHDTFFRAMDNLGKELSRKRKAVQGDKDLSQFGRQKKLGELEVEYREKVETLQKRFHGELAKGREGYEKTLNSPKQLTALDRLRMKINKAPGMEYEYIDDDQRALALIESNQAVVEALKRSTFINVAGRMSPEELFGAMDQAFQSGNQGAVENLTEVASIRGDEFGIKRGQGYADALKEQNMTPAQKMARVHLKRLDLHKQFFDWGTAKVLEGGEFQDLRGGDTDKGYDMELAQIKASTINKE